MSLLRFPQRVLLLSGCAFASTAPLSAQSTTAGVDLSVAASVVNNPYLLAQNNDWEGAGTIEARPWLRWQDQRESIVLRGLASLRAFTSNYDPEATFGLSLEANRRLDERTSVFGNANVTSSNRRSPSQPLLTRPGLTPATPATPSPLEIPILEPVVPLANEDIALLGANGRTTTISLGAGLSKRVSARSSIGMNIGYNKLIADDTFVGSGYDSVNLGVNYSRAVSDRTSVGVSATATKTRFEGPAPDTFTVGLYGNVSHQLNQYWSLNASLGVSATKSSSTLIYPGYSSVTPAGSLGACYTPPKEQLCATYSRAQQPSLLGDVRTSDSLSVTYSKSLTDRQRVDIDLGYSRSASSDRSANSGQAFAAYPDLEILRSRATYSQTFTDRLEGFVYGSASRSYGGVLSREPSIEFGLGIRLRLGDRR